MTFSQRFKASRPRPETRDYHSDQKMVEPETEEVKRDVAAIHPALKAAVMAELRRMSSC